MSTIPTPPELSSLLQFIGADEWEEILGELEAASKNGLSVDLDAMQCAVLKDLAHWFIASRAPAPQPSDADMLDAARYRWFRENAAREGRGYRLASAPGEQDQMPLKYRWHIDSKDLSTASLDAAIDAAMQSEQSKKGPQ